MNFPIPTHLQPLLAVIGEDNSEYEVTGAIHCSCNGEEFEVWESNDRQIVKLVCKQCGEETIILDSGKHGWDGFVCKNDFLDRTLPYIKYRCPDCGEEVFKIVVWISSQGKQDFLDECVSHDDSFSIDDFSFFSSGINSTPDFIGILFSALFTCDNIHQKSTPLNPAFFLKFFYSS